MLDVEGHVEANNLTAIREKIKHSHGTQFAGTPYKKEQTEK